jgi:hypothetical protein
VTDPIGNTTRRIDMAMHPIRTFNGIKSAYAEKLKTPEGQGEVAFEAALTLVTAGEAAAGVAGKAGLIGRSAATAEAAEVAGASRLLGHNEYVVANAAKQAKTQEGLMQFFQKHSPNPNIKWVDGLMNEGKPASAFLDNVTGEIFLDTSLKGRFAHLAKGYLMEELQHFHQVFTQGRFGRVLSDAEQALLESQVVQRILKSGFSVY